MTYEEYKQGLITELGRHIDEEHQRLIVIAEGTDNEEIAPELMQPPVCSQSLSIHSLYRQWKEGELTAQVSSICDYFEKKRAIETIEQLENVTIWAANFEKAAEKLEGNDIPYLPVGDMAVYFQFFDEVYDEDEQWPLDYKRPVQNEHLKQWGLTVQELFDKVKYFDMNERFQTVLDTSRAVLAHTLGALSGALPDTKDYYGVYSENGIAIMFYPEGLSEISRRLDDDLYVMPLSNDKILVCPISGHSLETLQEIVKKSNEMDKRAEVFPVQVSNMVFQFDAESLAIQPAAQIEKKTRHKAR